MGCRRPGTKFPAASRGTAGSAVGLQRGIVGRGKQGVVVRPSSRWPVLLAVFAATGLLSVGGASAATDTGAKPQTGGTLTYVKQTESQGGWDPVKFQGVPNNGDSPQQFAI